MAPSMKLIHASAVSAGICLMVLVASAQQKPDFSGRWVIVTPAESAGLEQVVKHDATTLTTAHASEGAGHATIYKLDGSESRNVIVSHGSDLVTLSRVSWSGNKLIITSATTYPDGRKLDQKQEWSLDSDGRLMIELTESMQGGPPTTTTLVHKKRST
ncbi:MAG TPA: hypothetical protein VES67_18725 [Vicinamibacterales bacterium]|nr:hypothetical protein [Vicinamibacterales bacterium]